MRLSFNTTGPCIEGEHYMLPPGDRLGRVLELIEAGKYFTLHAGRQTGKTTSAQWLVEHLNREGELRAIWVDVQTAREKADPAVAFKTVLNNLDWAIQMALSDVGVPADRARLLDDPSSAILAYLRDLSARCPRPLVVLFDEVDGLVGEAVVSFLTQLRQGYIARRAMPFPYSVALVGMRQVRDYILSDDQRHAVSWLGSSSPFNISAEAATLAAFTREQVAALLQQHTGATGQRFEPDAVERIWTLSNGHPWLVNALADYTVDRCVRDRSAPIGAAHVEEAKEAIILERRTHVDSLAARLREPRVHAVIAPLLEGTVHVADVIDEDFQYVRGLGLVAPDNPVRIANPIYREVIVRVLASPVERVVTDDPRAFVLPDGRLDMARLLTEFAAFWREHGDVLEQAIAYHEVAPQLVMMAYLQRIVNGGGYVDREYGVGRGRIDLCVRYPHQDSHGKRAFQREALELKEWAKGKGDPLAQGLKQLEAYLDRLGLTRGVLVIFDRRPEKAPIEERTRFEEARTAKGYEVTVLRG